MNAILYSLVLCSHVLSFFYSQFTYVDVYKTVDYV